jgi:Holliday junction resolvase RusA-like endonuclease
MQSEKTERKYLLNITPRSHCRVTKGDSVFFRIPRDKLRPAGLKRLLRIEQYNNYKLSLLAESKRVGFTLPPSGTKITFFFPTPPSWSKKKKKRYHGSLHQSRPDLDNCCKALFDALVSEDKHIANITLTKRWVDFPTGWIEISTDEFPEEPVNMPSVKE